MGLARFIKTLLLLGVFFGAFTELNAQEPAEVDSADYLEWNALNRLSWEDYRYRPLNRQRFDGAIAITNVKISARGSIKKGVPNFKVKVFFVKPDSWTSDSTDMNLLNHEQLHFDIGEIYAQKIREKIVEMKEDGVTSPEKYRATIRNLITVFKAYSGQYDRETSFGMTIIKQREWEQRINKRIDEILSN